VRERVLILWCVGNTGKSRYRQMRCLWYYCRHEKRWYHGSSSFWRRAFFIV